MVAQKLFRVQIVDRLNISSRKCTSMKALILAGGYATRLRPLSWTKPKLLFPIAGKPMLERTLKILSKAGVDTAVLAVNFMADELKKHFGSKYGRMKIQYSRERCPLGTGGPIRLARKVLGSKEPFFAMNGDILYEGDLSSMVKKHEQENVIATIALHTVEDASRFGLVEVDDKMHVSSFTEKPENPELERGLINAGIYLMSPAIFKYIPSGRKVSIEREVFPLLARECKLLGYELKGYWTDIGKISDYLEANFSTLKMEAPSEPIVRNGAKVSPNAVLNSPCLVMKKATIADGAVVGPFAVVGEGSTIKEDTNLERSVLFNNVCMEKSAKVTGSVISDGVYLSHDVKLGDGTVIGSGAVVGPGVKLEGGVKVCAFKEINQSITGPANVCG